MDKNKDLGSNWGASVWRQMCSELVWVIGFLEENPTSPKAWKQVYRTLQTYERLERRER